MVSVCVENICICPYVWCVSGECVEDICNMYMSLVLSLYGEFVWRVCVVSLCCECALCKLPFLQFELKATLSHYFRLFSFLLLTS